MATRQEDSNKHTDDSKKQIKIVIAGGSYSNSVEAYIENEKSKERKATWQLLPRPMNKGRHAASAVLYKEKEENEEKPSNNIQQDLLAKKREVCCLAAMLIASACTRAVSIV